MPAKLKPNSKLSRKIQVRGLESPVIVILTPEGLEMRAPGSRTSVQAEWHRVANALRTPGNIPSFLEGKPLDLLKYQIAKRKAKK